MFLIKKQILTLTAFIIIGFGVQAQYSPTDTIPKDPAIKVGKLKNGLTYYVRQNKKPEQKVDEHQAPVFSYLDQHLS